MNQLLYKKMNELLTKDEFASLCTIISSSGSAPRHEGTKMLVLQNGTIFGTVGGGEIEERIRKEALASISDQKPRLLKYSLIDPNHGDPGVCGGTVEVFVEPITPENKIIVVGGGHVGKAVVRLAKFLGYRVAVSDDREQFCTPEEIPDADEFFPVPMKDLPKATRITPSTYVVLATRGSSIDIEGMEPLLDTPSAFLGVIGSKRRWLTTKKALLDKGVDPKKLERVHSPLGLELNAETPEEIAVSIMAEIIMLKNNGTGRLMKAK